MPEAATPTTEILTFLSAVLDEHGAGGGSAGEFRVVAVVTDDAPGIAAVAPTILRHAGGTMLVAAECADGVPSACRPETAVYSAVREHLKVPQPEGDGHLVPKLVHRQGKTYPGFEDKDRLLDPDNKGHRELLGFAASLFHDELRKAELALVLIDETPLEEDLKELIWNFCTGTLPTTGLHGVHTLVVVLQVARIDYGRHCEGDASVRFAVTHGITQRRYPKRQPIRVNQLANGTQPLVMFLGAGFSQSSGLPLGNELRDRVLAGLLQAPDADLLETSQLPRLFLEWVKEEGTLRPDEKQLSMDEFCRRLTLERVIAEEIRPGGRIEESSAIKYFQQKHAEAIAAPGVAVRKLADIVQRRGDRPLVLVTVNFDELLEAQCGDDLEVAATNEQFTKMADWLKKYLAEPVGKVPYLKLHGTIGEPSSITASIKQTEAGLHNSRAEILRLLPGPSDAPRNWIYVGYSMRDLDLEPWLRQRELCEGAEEWWVQPFLDPNVADFVRQFRAQMWTDQPGRDANVEMRTLTETADTFFTTLASCWPT